MREPRPEPPPKPEPKPSKLRKVVDLVKACCDFVLAWLDYWKED